MFSLFVVTMFVFAKMGDKLCFIALEVADNVGDVVPALGNQEDAVCKSNVQ